MGTPMTRKLINQYANYTLLRKRLRGNVTCVVCSYITLILILTLPFVSSGAMGQCVKSTCYLNTLHYSGNKKLHLQRSCVTEECHTSE